MVSVGRVAVRPAAMHSAHSATQLLRRAALPWAAVPRPYFLPPPVSRPDASRRGPASAALATAAAAALAGGGAPWLSEARSLARRGRRQPGGLPAQAIVEDDVHSLAVRRWVGGFVVNEGLCPWAGPADSAGRLRVVTSSASSSKGAFADLVAEAQRLPDGGVEELPPGVATTTLLACPYVDSWRDFAIFHAFYVGPLADGYVFADQDLYVVPFHPSYGVFPDVTITRGDRIELGRNPDDSVVVGEVLDAHAGFGEAGQPLARVRVSGTGQECLICLPGPPEQDEPTNLVSRAPRPTLHLLRTWDLQRAEDPGLRARNRLRLQELGGAAAVEALIRQCG